MSCCCTTVETGSVKVRGCFWPVPCRTPVVARFRAQQSPSRPSCVRPARKNTTQVVERCGEFKYVANPGISFLLPCCDVPSNPISMRLQQIEVSCEVKTKDNVFTHMKVCAHMIAREGGMGHFPHATRERPRRTATHSRLLSSPPPSPISPATLSPLAPLAAGVHPVPDCEAGQLDLFGLLPSHQPALADRGVRVRCGALDGAQD